MGGSGLGTGYIKKKIPLKEVRGDRSSRKKIHYLT